MKVVRTKPKEKVQLVSKKQLPRHFIVKSLQNGKRHVARRSQSEQQETEIAYAVDNTMQGLEQGKNAAITSVRNLSERRKQIRHLTRTIKEKRVMQAAKSGASTAITTDCDTPKAQSTAADATQQTNAYHAGKQRAQGMAQTRRNRQMRFAGRGTAHPKSNMGTASSASISRQTIKTARRSIKESTRDIKTASSSVKEFGRSARVVVHPAPNAVQRMKHAAKATASATKRATKALVASVKVIVAVAKALIAILSAGGTVVILIAVVTILIVLVFGSSFGIFFSTEADEGKLTEAIIETQTDFSNMLQAEIDVLSSAGAYDSVEVHHGGDFEGDSDMANNWNDVLAVYAVKTMYEDEEVFTMTPEKAHVLKGVFNDMNQVKITSVVEEIVQEDEEENTCTIRHLHIYIRIMSLDYLEGAALYAFTESMLEVLEEMMSPAYYEYFAKILDVEMYDGLARTDVLEIVTNLPVGTKGGVIAHAAISKVGTPYSQMDCSQLSAYAYGQSGVSLPRTSVAQAQYCYNNGYAISATQLQPGDLIFWSKSGCNCGRWGEVHHVGIYIGNGQIVDASSQKGRVLLRNMWEGAGYTVMMYARAHV